MRVLAMASQKGGSGKTTLSGHLAVQAQLSGAGPVCLIDIDPQGSLADWWNEREADMPPFAKRTDYAASMLDGRTVREIDPNARSAKEVIELWDYISGRLKKNFRRTVFAAPGAAPGAPAAAPRPVGGFGRRVVGQ